MRPTVAALVLMAAVHAHAAPPPGADPDSPTAKWLQQWYDADGELCCSVADCRPTAVVPGDSESGLVAFIGRDRFGPTAPDQWMPVDKRAYNPPKLLNPTGSSWACWYSMRVRCAWPEGGY
jgi:hypothetical protein